MADKAHAEAVKSEVISDVIMLRTYLRDWLAVNGASHSRWFGGSRDLHAMCANALFDKLLMHFRRLLIGRGSDVSLHPVMESLRDCATAVEERAQYQHGLDELAVLRREPDIEHLINLANKVLAHSNVAGLKSIESRIPDLRTTEFNLRTVARALDRVSAYTRKYLAQDYATLDAWRGTDDPFLIWVPNDGLPGLDYEPKDLIRGGEPADPDQMFIAVEIEVWNEMIGALAKPLPEEVCVADGRRWRATPARGRNVGELADRWGRETHEIHSFLFERRKKLDS